MQFLKKPYWIILCLTLLSMGCSLQSSGKTVKSSKNIPSGDKLFNSEDIEPEGNAYLHYIDAQLQKLQNHDPLAVDAMRRAVGSDPQSAYLHAEMARYLAESDQFEQATLETDKALELEPKNPELYLLKGKLFSVKKEHDQALKQYTQCIEIDPDLEDCYTMEAREYLVSQEYSKAKKALLAYMKRHPEAIQPRYLYATLNTRDEKDYPQAIALYEEILKDDPKHLKSLAALSEIYLKEKKYDKALDVFLRLEAMAPSDIATKLRVGLLYYEQENYPEAIKRFARVLELQPKNDRVHYYLGILESQNNNNPQAVKYFKAVPPSSEYYKDSIIRLAVSYGQMENIGEAIRYTKQALKTKKDAPELYDLLGNLYAQEENDTKSLKAYEDGLKKFPKHEKLLFGKGVLLDKMGQFDKSMTVMREILAINPNHTQALNYLGYSYADRDMNLQEALTLLQRAHALQPEDGYIMDSLAWAHFKLGHTEKARELLQKANKISPEEPTILEHLGDVYLKMGQRDKAKDFYRDAVAAAIKAKPRDARERQDLERIRRKLAKMEY